MYQLGLIGNCQASALVGRDGSIDWMCLPRPDSPPVFGRLLDPQGGHFSIAAARPGTSSQRYLESTNVLETIHEDAEGNRFAVIDFFPRFEQFGRTYRPLMLMRKVIPLSGLPKINVEIQPVQGWSKEPAPMQRGSSHVRFLGLDDELRLSTTMPLTQLLAGTHATLSVPLYFILTWGVPPEDDLATLVETFQLRTEQWWRNWVMGCNTPVLFQREVIRSALALKLHCFEETGAVLAAITTSLPEIVGDVRNWDYRFCWLRDAYFTVSAIHRLGHFEELEGILRFMFDVIHRENVGRLHPVYRVDGTRPLPETERTNWAGYRGSKPVRTENQAAEHVQNDVYGQMLMMLSRLYFDERFAHLRSRHYDELLATLAARCLDTLDEPDAGLWELRGDWKPHTYTAMMSWTALDRYARLIGMGRIRGDAAQIDGWRDTARAAIERAVSDGVLWSAPGHRTADSALLLLPTLGFPDRGLCERTVDHIAKDLAWGGDPASGFYYRYRHHDDFGTPKHPFLICSFWMAEALARLGRVEEGAAVLGKALKAANPLGLFAEHFDPATTTQSGNFPQCYSHVGLIMSAFAVSPSWHTVL